MTIVKHTSVCTTIIAHSTEPTSLSYAKIKKIEKNAKLATFCQKYLKQYCFDFFYFFTEVVNNIVLQFLCNSICRPRTVFEQQAKNRKIAIFEDVVFSKFDSGVWRIIGGAACGWYLVIGAKWGYLVAKYQPNRPSGS